MRRLLVLLGLLPSLAACSFVARDTATYERETSALLDGREAEVSACYAAELARNPDLVGKLTVTFVVEKKTGKLTAIAWDRNRSSVGETLATCVLSAFAGLALPEPDRRDGQATFTYRFSSTAGP